MLHTATGSGEKASEMSSSKIKEESISDENFGIRSDERICCRFAPTEEILEQLEHSLMRVLTFL